MNKTKPKPLLKVYDFIMKIFMRFPNNISIILFFLIGASIGMQSQTLPDSIVYRPEVEREFVEAMKSFQAGKFDTASVLFIRIIKDSPRSHRATGAFIMGAKAFYELKNFRESIRLLKDLIDIYPQSSYVDDAHYTLGLNYYRMGRYEDAASKFLVVVQTPQEQQLDLKKCWIC